LIAEADSINSVDESRRGVLTKGSIQIEKEKIILQAGKNSSIDALSRDEQRVDYQAE